MMKAYNIAWIQNLHIQQTAADWLSRNLLTSEQHEQVVKQFPSHFYNPGWFVKIGLFFFGLAACSFLGTFIAAFFIDTGSDTSLALVSLVCCAVYLFGLEFVIRERKVFHSGIDNALLYAAWLAALAPVFLLIKDASPEVYCIAGLAVTIPAVIRYADLLAAAACFSLLFNLLFLLTVQLPFGKTIISFVMMGGAAAVYFAVRKSDSIYYSNCRKTVEVLALMLFYLSANYFVVREGNALLNGANLKVAPQIPLAGLFYLLTIAIPLGYIFRGLKKQDRLLLIVGLITFGIAIYTFKHYYSNLTAAQELTLAGALLIAFAGLTIRYLRKPKFGISDEPASRRRFADLQAIVAAQVIDQPGGNEGVNFGGGNFGGGGAGESY